MIKKNLAEESREFKYGSDCVQEAKDIKDGHENIFVFPSSFVNLSPLTRGRAERDACHGILLPSSRNLHSRIHPERQPQPRNAKDRRPASQ